MLGIEAVAETLMRRDVTVAIVAQQIGTLGERRSSDYGVVPSDKRLGTVSIGTSEGQDLNFAPAYVRYIFPDNEVISLAEVIPNCSQWKQIENNPGSSPYLYSCRFKGSNVAIEVIYVVELTGEKDSHASHVRDITLQRNDWL